MPEHSFREFDSVEVLAEFGERGERIFPGGTRAAIVDLSSENAFVEVVEQDGRAYGPHAVALSDLGLIAHAPALRHASEDPPPMAHREV